jgi:hypothetical protein
MGWGFVIHIGSQGPIVSFGVRPQWFEVDPHVRLTNAQMICTPSAYVNLHRVVLTLA